MNEIVTHYDINPSTLALLPAAHSDYSTIVLELNRKLFVRKTPIQLIKPSCLDGGAEYEGRRKAVIHLTGSKQKVPIPINPGKNIFAFPTHSPQAPECSWIFYNHVKTITPNLSSNPETSQSIITFKNGQQLPMNESMHILQKQMQRTALCILQFSNQWNEMYAY